jgi:hypothetical protein
VSAVAAFDVTNATVSRVKIGEPVTETAMNYHPFINDLICIAIIY